MSSGRGGGECLLPVLPPDAFGCIVELVAERLRPETDAGFYTDQSVRTLCKNFLEARRELRTLALVPGQAVAPKYLCTDPNGALWQHAHIIFGIDPDAPGFGKVPRCSLRDHFLLLRAAFAPNLEYEVWRGDFSSRVYGAGKATEWETCSVWDQLWCNWESEEVARWENDAAHDAYNDYVAEHCGSGEDDFYFAGEHDDFETWYANHEENRTLPKYPVSEQELVWFHSKLRLPRGALGSFDEPELKKLRQMIRLMLCDMGGTRGHLATRELEGADDGKRHVFLPPRPVRRPGRPAKYDWVGPTVQAQEEALVRKLEALRVLVRTMKRQLKGLGA